MRIAAAEPGHGRDSVLGVAALDAISKALSSHGQGIMDLPAASAAALPPPVAAPVTAAPSSGALPEPAAGDSNSAKPRSSLLSFSGLLGGGGGGGGNTSAKDHSSGAGDSNDSTSAAAEAGAAQSAEAPSLWSRWGWGVGSPEPDASSSTAPTSARAGGGAGAGAGAAVKELASKGSTLVVTKDFLYVREGVSTSTPIIGRLVHGQRCLALDVATTQSGLHRVKVALKDVGGWTTAASFDGTTYMTEIAKPAPPLPGAGGDDGGSADRSDAQAGQVMELDRQGGGNVSDQLNALPAAAARRRKQSLDRAYV